MFKIIEYAISKILQLDPMAPDILKMLKGKTAYIEINDVGLAYALNFTEEGIQFISKEANCPEIIIKGPTLAFLSLAFQKDPKRALQLGLSIEGDLDSAEKLQTLFLKLDLDWEELLSRFTNDVIAHQVGDFLRNTRKKQQTLVTNLSKNSALYLSEEAKILPTKDEIQQWMNEVDDLKNDVDRCDLRIKRLTEKTETSRENQTA